MDIPSSSLADDFEIITALRKDNLLSTMLVEETQVTSSLLSSQLYMLHRHRDRMLTAAKAFNWPELSQRQILGLEGRIRDHLQSTYLNRELTDPLKVRVALSSDGILSVTSMKIAAVPHACLFPKTFSDLISQSDLGCPPTFRVLISPIHITPCFFTRHKTTSRSKYDNIRSKTVPVVQTVADVLDPLPIEILLFNKLGQVMEGTITTPFFYRGGRWITPAKECGGNIGTTRQYALDRRLCMEGVVEIADVKVGEKVILSNGVRGFGWGAVEELGVPTDIK